jgi:hypothetical protein
MARVGLCEITDAAISSLPRIPVGRRRTGRGQCVEWAANAAAPDLEDVGVDHRCADVAVTEQLLDRPDVVPSLQEVGRERMTQAVRRRRLVDSSPLDGSLERPLKCLVVRMVATDHARAWICRVVV